MINVTLSEQDEVPARVLVVDDDVDMLELARMLLEPRGYEVDVAVDGRQGLVSARTSRYDVIVTDITMPHMDGIEFGHALRADQTTRDAIIVVHSALDESWVRRSFAGYDLFLAKPEHTGRLVAAVAQLLQERLEHTEEAVRAVDH